MEKSALNSFFFELALSTERDSTVLETVWGCVNSFLMALPYGVRVTRKFEVEPCDYKVDIQGNLVAEKMVLRDSYFSLQYKEQDEMLIFDAILDLDQKVKRESLGKVVFDHTGHYERMADYLGLTNKDIFLLNKLRMLED